LRLVMGHLDKFLYHKGVDPLRVHCSLEHSHQFCKISDKHMKKDRDTTMDALNNTRTVTGKSYIAIILANG
jgi:hypothetical protein